VPGFATDDFFAGRVAGADDDPAGFFAAAGEMVDGFDWAFVVTGGCSPVEAGGVGWDCPAATVINARR
jgi:hypothetical protein